MRWSQKGNCAAPQNITQLGTDRAIRPIPRFIDYRGLHICGERQSPHARIMPPIIESRVGVVYRLTWIEDEILAIKARRIYKYRNETST